MNFTSLVRGEVSISQPGMDAVAQVVYESFRPVLDVLLASAVKQDEIISKQQEILLKIENFERLAGTESLSTDSDVIFETPKVKPDKVVYSSKQMRSEIRACVVSASKKLGLPTKDVWGRFYEYASLDIGFNPYFIGKETKNGKQCEKKGQFIQTVENRGKLPILLESARRWARKYEN